MLWINAFHQQFCPTPKLSEYALTGNEKTMIVFVVFCVAPESDLAFPASWMLALSMSRMRIKLSSLGILESDML